MTVGISYSNLEDKLSVIITDTQATTANGRGVNSSRKQATVENDNYAAVLFAAGGGFNIGKLLQNFQRHETCPNIVTFINEIQSEYNSEFHRNELSYRSDMESHHAAVAKSMYGEGSFNEEMIREGIASENRARLFRENYNAVKNNSELVNAIINNCKEEYGDTQQLPMHIEKALERRAIIETEDDIDKMTAKQIRNEISNYVLKKMQDGYGDMTMNVNNKFDDSQFIVQAYDKGSDMIRNFYFDAKGVQEMSSDRIEIGTGRDLSNAHANSERLGTASVNWSLPQLVFQGLGSYAHSTSNSGVGGTPFITVMNGKMDPTTTYGYDHFIAAAMTNIASLYQAGVITDKDKPLEMISKILSAGTGIGMARDSFKRNHHNLPAKYDFLMTDDFSEANFGANYEKLKMTKGNIQEDYDTVSSIVGQGIDKVKDVCKYIGRKVGLSADVLMSTTIPYSSWKEMTNFKKYAGLPRN